MQTQWKSRAKSNNGSETQSFACSMSSLQRHIKDTLLRLFLYLQIFATRITFLQASFAKFLVDLRHFWQYVEFEDRYSKKPVSVTKKDINDHIYQLIHSSQWFYGSGFVCQNSSKMTNFRLKMRILWHNANLDELLNPENGWPWHCPTTYLKAEKGDISP